jgi:hypothetical protein
MRTFVCRWYWWLPALLVAAGVGYVGYRAMHPPWEGTEAWRKYREIRMGMTEAEAESVLREGGSGTVDVSGGHLGWRDGEDRVVVFRFGEYPGITQKEALIQGRVFREPDNRERSWWDRWRARLGW